MKQPAPTDVSGVHAIHQMSIDIQDTTKNIYDTHTHAVDLTHLAFNWVS